MYRHRARLSFLFQHGCAREFSPDPQEESSPTFQRGQIHKSDRAWYVSCCETKEAAVLFGQIQRKNFGGGTPILVMEETSLSEIFRPNIRL
jgi:hypothetical protein